MTLPKPSTRQRRPQLPASQLPIPPSAATDATTMMQMHPSKLPGTQPNYPEILIYLLRGPTASVIIGTFPCVDIYNIPIELLRWHSAFFQNRIRDLQSARVNQKADKKRKRSAENEPTIILKVEDEENEQAETTSKAQTVPEDPLVIELPHVEPDVFELFLKFVYMGYYSFEINARRPAGNSSSNTPERSPTNAAMQARELAQTQVSANPTNARSSMSSAGGMLPPPIPHPRSSTPRSHSPSLTQDRIPPSIRAWLLGARIGAFRFANHAMVHIHSSIGYYFQITPNLVYIIWQCTTLGCILRRLIIDFLLVYWTEPSSDRQHINRHPGLDQHWMQAFDAHPDLKSLFVLGLGSKNGVASPEAYFVHPQMPAVVSKIAMNCSEPKDAVTADQNGREEVRENSNIQQDGGAKGMTEISCEDKGEVAGVKLNEVGASDEAIQDA